MKIFELNLIKYDNLIQEKVRHQWKKDLSDIETLKKVLYGNIIDRIGCVSQLSESILLASE